MNNTHVLGLQVFEKPFYIETDVGATGIGVVLLQEGRPIAYYKKTLSVHN
jgi:hypothetical protein